MTCHLTLYCVRPVLQVFNCLRIPPEVEEIGLDRSKHGGSAYNIMHSGAANDIMRNVTPKAKDHQVAPLPPMMH